MIVPQYWAEAKVKGRVAGRNVTVRRFGWSDESEAAALQHAEERAQEALARLQHDRSLRKREPKVPYNGADGVPIREEIVQRHGDVIITRNSYGALCLNSPDVLFADVDSDWRPGIATFLLLVAAAAAAAVATFAAGGRLLILITVPVAYALAASILRRLRQWLIAARGGQEAAVRRRLDRFLAKNETWRVRTYQTPHGFRLLAVHATFDPRSNDVQVFFRAVGADPIYVRMCVRQRCFRARLTAKPWRIGIRQHLRPRRGIWPTDPTRMPERRLWLAAYDQVAANYAACKFIADAGSGNESRKAIAVAALHDRLAQATSDLPLA